MRSYFAQKLGRLRMRHDGDLEGLRALKEAAATTIMVASQCDDKPVMTDLFDMVHQRLTHRLRHDLLAETGAQRNVEKIVAFLEKELNILVTNELACGKWDQPKRQERKQRPKAQEEESPSENVKCYFCNKEGHFAKDCEKLAKAKCFGCNGVGHTSKYCTNKSASKYRSSTFFEMSKKREGINAASWRKQVAKIDAQSADKKPRCKVTVDESETAGVMDTGADETHVPETVVNTDAPLRSFTMADGKSVLWSKGPVEAELKIGDMTVTHPVYTYKGNETIIGSDLLDKYGAIIDYSNNRSVTFTKAPSEAEDKPEKQVNPTESTKAPERKLEKLVQEEYGDLTEGLGKTDLTEHVIDTGDHKPIAVRGRRIPAQYVDAVAEHVKALLGEDIIEESNSEWLFPIVIVKKKDGEIRMANDLRKLNEICKKDSYPMPRVDEFFERIGDAQVFSRVDLRKGYY